MTKLCFLLCFFVFFLSTLFSQADLADYKEAFTLLDVWIDAQKDYENLPGITASLTIDQNIVWKTGAGYANPKEKVAMSPSTLFSICSISKLFTAVAIMKLYDEGKLRLDDEIDDLLPWYNLKQKYPDSGPITIRTLLTHSSGLPREAAYPYWTGPDFPFPTSDMIIEKLENQETLYPASNYFQYSNLGLTLLGEIVEEVSDQNFDDYIYKNIIEPLELQDTRTELPQDLYGSNLAVGFSSITRNGDREKVNFFQANGIGSAAGFSSNVLDLGKFASWQFRLLETRETEILRPSTLDYMHRVQWTDPDWETTWGLGFSVYKSSNGSTLVGHGGSCPGYRSGLIMEPDKKLAWSVMINASGTNPSKYINGIRAMMKKYKSFEESDTSGIKKEDLNDYCGHYNQQPWWGELYITSWKGKLVSLDLPSDQPGESLTFFKHLEGDVFQRIRDNNEPGETIIFERDGEGRVVRMKRHSNYVTRIEKRNSDVPED
jgi:CubicO group peptidase (beta-lactamase class C family)